LLSLGILGEYVARIYTESKQRPLFLLHGRPRSRGVEVQVPRAAYSENAANEGVKIQRA